MGLNDVPPCGRRAGSRPDAEGITYTHIHGSAHLRARPISTHIVSNLCSALQFLVRRHKFNAACGFQQATRSGFLANGGRSGLWLRRIHGGLADGLAYFAGLLRQRTHLRLHIFAVQPHYLGQILGLSNDCA